MNSMTDQRQQLLQSWLSDYYNMNGVPLTPVSGDASFRRYFRFNYPSSHNSDPYPLIAVDAPPEQEDSQPFVDVCEMLYSHQCAVPKIYLSSLKNGFFVIEDFGDQLLLNRLNDSSADELYNQAMQSIIKMQTINASTLPAYNSELLQREMQLFTDWYLLKHKNIQLDENINQLLTDTYQKLESNALEQPQVFVHRDYHSRNLMVREKKPLGIIDFQDAVQGPITYDLVSLLRDCYIDWPQNKIDHWSRQFFDMLPESQITYETFMRWFDLMGIQRHLKASGIFCRLNYRDNKPAYINDIPRTLHYVQTICARYPEFKDFNEFVSKTL
ncbi:MAG: phosphotransferase [Pseudomonadota bacterium]